MNHALNFNEMVYCKTAKEACETINEFMKYDASAILEEKLRNEGEIESIMNSKRSEMRDMIAYLTEKRSQLIQCLQETENNKDIQSALELVESEIRKFEKQLQESYVE